MPTSRAVVSILLVALAAPVAASVYALAWEGASSSTTGLAAVLLLLVVVLSVAHAIHRRSRPETPYW